MDNLNVSASAAAATAANAAAELFSASLDSHWIVYIHRHLGVT